MLLLLCAVVVSYVAVVACAFFLDVFFVDFDILLALVAVFFVDFDFLLALVAVFFVDSISEGFLFLRLALSCDFSCSVLPLIVFKIFGNTTSGDHHFAVPDVGF